MTIEGSGAAADLMTTLGQADAALARGDTEAANEAMAAAADLCSRLQAAGLGVPAGELATLQEIADRCGVALLRLGQDLNAESFRGDNLRRGMRTYNGDSGR